MPAQFMSVQNVITLPASERAVEHRKKNKVIAALVAGIGASLIRFFAFDYKNDPYAYLEDNSTVEGSNEVLNAFGFEKKIWHNNEVWFKKSNYLNKFDDFWKVESLFGGNKINEMLDEQAFIISDNFFDSLFKKYSDKLYYTDTHKHYLFDSNDITYEKEFGKLVPIDGLSALKNYGIDILERVKERSYTRISK